MLKHNLFAHDVWDGGSMRPGFKWRNATLGRRLRGNLIGASMYDLISEEDRTYPYHFHHGTEEWMVVVNGTPILRMPWGERELRQGDIVCFKPGPEGAHQVIGPGTVLILSANCTPDTVEYPDSGKVAARPPGKVFYDESAIDYWEGELPSEKSDESEEPKEPAT